MDYLKKLLQPQYIAAAVVLVAIYATGFLPVLTAIAAIAFTLAILVILPIEYLYASAENKRWLGLKDMYKWERYSMSPPTFRFLVKPFHDRIVKPVTKYLIVAIIVLMVTFWGRAYYVMSNYHFIENDITGKIELLKKDSDVHLSQF